MTPEYIMRKSLCRAEDIQRAQSEIEYLNYAHEYGEPGYTNSIKGILFANWNYFPRGLDRILKRAGYEIEWSDEWTVAQNGKAYRISPNCYGWKTSIIYSDNGEEFCRDHIEDYIDDYITHLLNCPHRADTFDINWTSHGFQNLNGIFETGQNADPRKILKEYQARFPTKEFLFQIADASQFDLEFTIWGRDAQN